MRGSEGVNHDYGPVAIDGGLECGLIGWEKFFEYWLQRFAWSGLDKRRFCSEGCVCVNICIRDQ
jgi:hypothetical protein